MSSDSLYINYTLSHTLDYTLSEYETLNGHHTLSGYETLDAHYTMSGYHTLDGHHTLSGYDMFYCQDIICFMDRNIICFMDRILYVLLFYFYFCLFLSKHLVYYFI